MGVYLFASLLLVLLGSFRACALELVANYKFWDSVSGQIIYDYSGNSNHGLYWYTPLYTDRGLTDIFVFIYIRGLAMISKPIEGYSDFSVSFWALRTITRSSLHNSMVGDQVHSISYTLQSSETTLSYYDDVNSSSYFNCPESKAAILGWNLYTMRLYSNDSTTRHLELYHNLILIRKYDSPGFNSILNIKTFQLSGELIFYEMWAHTGFSSISDLNTLIYNDCPTSPSQICLPLYSKYQNYQGTDCPTECTSQRLSCDSTLSCIQLNKSDCLFGVYHRDTGHCIFYTPEDSAVCSTSTYNIKYYQITRFECSCKEGFKKIADELIGCVPESWTNYHRVGYVYLEQGYTLDENGNCCICDEGYAATSISPLVCEFVSYCLEYIQEDNKNVCKTLKPGYKLDSLGNCCICDEDYIAVSISPLACEYMPNCLSYSQEDSNYICSQCIEGYQLNSSSQCLECSEGYEKISDNSLMCVVKIENCLEYNIIGDIWVCNSCLTGYRLSISGLCNECQEGYSKIDQNSSICMTKIEKCIEYDFYSEHSKCLSCEIGYKLDSNYECSSCDSRYVSVSDDPLECAFEVLNCSIYTVYEGDWVCNRCKKGYKFDNRMRCSLCAEGYSSQSVELFECLPIPDDAGNSSDTSDQDAVEEEEITQTEKDNGERIQIASTVIISAAIFTTSVSAILSMNPSIFIFYLTTIQLLSLIHDFNIELPYEIKEEYKTVNNIMKDLNIFSYIEIENKNPSDYFSNILHDDGGFIPNTIYQLFTLALVFIFNIIFYFMKKYTKGKTQQVTERIFKIFTYTIYIQYILITYLDIADSALFKIIHVLYI